MKQDPVFNESKQLILTMLREAKHKFLRLQDYEMAAKMRVLERIEEMEWGSRERIELVREAIEFYK